eukprot:29586-Pelagococcus_subviridis.AAC.13
MPRRTKPRARRLITRRRAGDDRTDPPRVGPSSTRPRERPRARSRTEDGRGARRRDPISNRDERGARASKKNSATVV